MPSRRHSGVEVAAQLTHSRPSGRDNEVDVLVLGGHLFSVSVIALAPREIEIEWDYRISRIPPSPRNTTLRFGLCLLAARCWSILIGETHLNFSRRRRLRRRSRRRRRRLHHPKPARHFEDYRRSRYVTPREMSQAMNGKGRRGEERFSLFFDSFSLSTL